MKDEQMAARKHVGERTELHGHRPAIGEVQVIPALGGAARQERSPLILEPRTPARRGELVQRAPWDVRLRHSEQFARRGVGVDEAASVVGHEHRVARAIEPSLQARSRLRGEGTERVGIDRDARALKR